MKKIFLIFIFFQSLVFANDIIGTIIFENSNYYKSDKNEDKIEKKSEKKQVQVVSYKSLINKTNKTSNNRLLYDKRNLLKKRGINFLVWSDRIDENSKVIKILLSFKDKEISRIKNFTIVASKDYTFVSSKTGFLFVSPNTNKKDLLKYLKNKSNKKSIKKKKNKIKGSESKNRQTKSDIEVDNNELNFYKSNAKKLQVNFKFRNVLYENELFIQLVQISESELPILYQSIIIPTLKSKVERNNRTGVIYIDTRATKEVVLRNLK
ncbi:MAG: hypothetical protein U9Q66_03355 [Patescibacteria group bacterium]|nr:hypothetical protein [Patescibacteria group bacterium]